MSMELMSQSMADAQKEAETLGACPICGDDSADAKLAMLEYAMVAEGAAVCGDCATTIANAFSKKHSGQWLTWPNEAAQTKRKKTIPQWLRTQVFERDLYRCLRCGTHKDLRADHIVPESEGGDAALGNLQTLCAPCNSWKGVKTIDLREGSQ